MKDLSNYRKTYQKKELLESQIPNNPIILFENWFNEIERFDTINEVNSMTLSTIGIDGFPKSRVVLLKNFSQKGFVFYTNYNSEKGKSIAQNPNVCLSFFWQSIERQVVIKGKAQKTSENTSNNYFASRPNGSKLGAIASPQSDVIPSRQFLEDSLNKVTLEYKDKEITRPQNWGGYLVVAHEIEFWQGRPNRLHDRIRYTLQPNLSWLIERLSS